MQIKPYILKNCIQHYQWGTRGEKAFIPVFLNIPAEQGIPYAELWMGAHAKAPSIVLEEHDEIPLNQMIEQYPLEMLGEAAVQKFSGKLPYLFKILSIGDPLSIQAHPSKPQAEILHEQDPVNYPDDNHKPEIAVALDSLTALCGFRPLDEIKEVFKKYSVLEKLLDNRSELNDLMSIDKGDEQLKRQGLKQFFTNLLNKAETENECFQSVVDSLEKKLAGLDKVSERERLFLECSKKYPHDVGLLSIFLLNLVHLKSGEGLFMGPGIPHAYLSGNIVECMANSDNVIRAGLTPKFQDVRRLTEVLTYESGLVNIISKSTADTIDYCTPAQEFELSRLVLEAGKKFRPVRKSGPEILLVFNGVVKLSWESGKTGIFRQGKILFIPSALQNLDLESEEKTIIYRVRIP